MKPTSPEGANSSGKVLNSDAEASELLAGEGDGRFQTFAGSAADAIIVIDAASVIHFINRAAEKIFGYPVRELLGQNLTMLMPDYLRHVHRAGLERYLSTGERHINWGSVELPGLHRDGHEIALEISFGEFVEDGGRYFTGIARDITERKRQKEKQRFLVEASALLSASLDYETTLQSVARLSVPFLADWCIVYVVDGDGGAIRPIAVMHEDAARVELVWQLERQENQNSNAPTGVPKAIRTGRAELYEEIPAPADAATANEAGRFRVARQLDLRSAMIVPLVARGRTLGAITFATSESGRRYNASDLALAEDLAQRAAFAVDNARLYREAQEANRLKDEFLATLSHELRTPLTSILGWTNLLRSVKFDEVTSVRALETIERNARSQKQLIDDLLDASRIITGKLRLELEPTQLKAVVESACHAARPAADARGIEIQLALDPAASLVAGDAERLQQVVWNLLSNAVKFTPEGGRVEVGLARKGTQAQISVRDTGQGIEAKFLPYVFDRFRQADQSTTRTHGGLGLGLAIVRHLVELHGGTVAAESAGAGKGATFKVMLPLLKYAKRGETTAQGETRLEDAGEQNERQAVLGGLRILIVEDEPDTRLLLKKSLERFGAIVEACESADEALTALEASAFDVILSDIAMPGEDGYTLIEKIREHDTATPAIAFTAHARQEDKERALAAGFQLHLAKPIAPKELAEAVAGIVARTSNV
ncbi:MAG TPA: ATP-binding protein [Pyrinomonadaceae bacterium]|nr:ATP-binding protein [Pyrinomonadaceae bacterium]